MKIAAIIPARMNSKRIPNKNIRLLNNYPMIYYAIRNALNSKYITDVIVTTDSPEIEIISQQLDVKCHRRASELCTDQTPLECVIYDAMQGEEYDYIVTMQPTSPTLQVATLDHAIAYALEKKLDTLISVINKPGLHWKKQDSKIIPAYQNRINSQYLPSDYCETGAFFISKGSVTTKCNRIGEAIEIYEIPRDEAVNVDTFQNLALANLILQKKSVAIYVNGNNLRGVGHIYRALELADEFYSRPDIYYDKNQTEKSIFGSTDHNLIPVNGLDELLVKIKDKNYDIFINDILSTSIDYMIALRNCLPQAKLVNFEDDGEGIYKADLVFNALYENTNLANVKYGSKYYIASKLFLFYQPIQIKETVSNILVTFGGADPQNYTDRILKIICKKKYAKQKFYVVLGRAKKNVDALMKYNECGHIQILYDIKNMPEIMSKCDIAVTSRGRTGFEVAVLGIPTIAMAQNQREEKHGFVNHENGFNYLGLNPSDNIIESNLDIYINMPKEERQHYHEMLLGKDLRHGRQRVMSLIQSL